MQQIAIFGHLLTEWGHLLTSKGWTLVQLMKTGGHVGEKAAKLSDKMD